MANEKAQEMANLSSQICNQISSVLTKPTSPYPPPLDLLVTELTAISRNRNNSRIFLYGVGREGLMLKAFAMRLFHLGLPTHLVFDMTTPPISSSDLLIASAGPGGFSTVDALCSVAKSNGAKVILITAEPAIGSCVKHATDVCYVPAQTMASDNGGGDSVEMGERRLSPMGSVYEGALFVLFEMVVYKLGEVLGESSESVRARHTNLE